MDKLINRRTLIGALPLWVGLHAAVSHALFGESRDLVTRAELDRLLDTGHPESHCAMRHDHSAHGSDDWAGSLRWSASDCGHNEGAGPAIKLAVRNGLSYPAMMYGCAASESLIPQINEAIKNPAALDQYLGMASPSQIAAVRDMLKQGKSFTEILVTAPDEAVGEVWRRKPMLRFACSLARKGKLAPAVAIAIASQWHNCQEFKCLLRHPNEIARWLQTQAIVAIGQVPSVCHNPA
jgi:hypothetical protein